MEKMWRKLNHILLGERRQFERLQAAWVKSLSRVWLFATPLTVATRLLRPWTFPGKSTRVDCHFLLQGIFPTHGSNLGLLIAGRCFTLWATREAHCSYSPPSLLSWLCCSALCGKSWPEWTTHLPSLVSGNHGGWKTPDWHGCGESVIRVFSPIITALTQHPEW